ncbi:MAG: hypothetical protein JWM56_1280 [Candidatus Peribacteria bacterium]|nr:hypothetical protein [Candidatus Peribacteria bacterium]
MNVRMGLGLLLVVWLPAASAKDMIFTDVSASDSHATAIEYVKKEGIMSGYADGLFRPGRALSRAEFTKIVILAAGDESVLKKCTSTTFKEFSDVPDNAWYARFVCAGVKEKFVEGNPDGTFLPAQKVNVAEASAVLARAFTIHMPAAKKNEQWYVPVIQAMGKRHLFPPSVETPQSTLTRSEVAEMIWRLRVQVRSQSSSDPETMLAANCDYFTEDTIPGVDMEEVRRVWLSWINSSRMEEDLEPYMYDKQLNRTAFIWSKQAEEKGSISHKREGQTLYYDYPLITQWFEKLGLSFENRNKVTFSENIGWGMYRCNKTDCTKNFLTALRPTFDSYMSEKDKQSRPHYNSIMNKEFTAIGMGVAVDAVEGTFYVTTHYDTAITSNPPPVCP